MHIKLFALCQLITLVMSTSIHAEGLSKNEYLQSKSLVLTEHDLEEKACDSLTSNANEMCMAEANGKKRNELAKLYSVYKPSANASYQVLTTSANTAYAIAIAKCNGSTVKLKSTCWTTAEETKINSINAAGMHWSKSLE